ncbi:MAG: two-component regulator propeller domain-containing protein [Parabacteroides merdae]
MADRSITHLQKSLTNEYTISDNAAYSITKDREGGIWATTFFGGINYLPKEYVPFKYFIGGKTHPGMPGNAVREICPDRYGNPLVRNGR